MPAYKFSSRSDAEVATQEAEQQFDYDREEQERRTGPHGTVHDNLRRFRIRNGFKKQEMAEFMEVTRRSYYTYEEGKRAIPSSALVKLAIVTQADLNEILLGRPSVTKQLTIETTVRELNATIEYLGVSYPKMDLATRLKVACFFAKYDWGDVRRVQAENIREAVRVVTGYRFHPEELPPPPLAEHFGERQDLYEEALASWNSLVGENDAEAHEAGESSASSDDIDSKGL
jgi:transcriptional regulator with XRE-family HTH domain